MYHHITFEPNPYYGNQRDPKEPCQSNIAAVGWEGDDCSVVVTMRGTFYARYGQLRCAFSIADETGPLTWENRCGYLPCLVTSFNRGDVAVEIAHFCNKVVLDGQEYSLLYTRVKKTNNGSQPVCLPAEPSIELVRLTHVPGTIAPGETEIEDFVTPVDKFGKDVQWPSVSEILCAGSWDENFCLMRRYWEERLSGMVQIEKLPDERLVNAFRAGSIYQLIVMRGLLPAVGVNAYRDEFNHDIIGMVETMIECGDLDLARRILDKYRGRMPAPLDYPDGDFKYPWPWAVYLLKTGDTEFVKGNFDVIRTIIHESVENDLTGPGGIVRESMTHDFKGYWLVDNWSLLTGLAAYRIICDRLGETEESAWALGAYDTLMDAANNCLDEVARRDDLDYLPATMLNSFGKPKKEKSTDCGWASIFHFGRWPWEAYMLGARQEGIMLDRIDPTYDWGFRRLEGMVPKDSFGGWSWSTSYCAGFAFSGLRGERYRSQGIRSYQFMIDHAMSGPFSWWEAIDAPDPDCPWQPGSHPSVGRGSCPHMWGDSFSRKVLLNSLIAEFADGRALIGRGIPEEWLESGQEIRISNVPLQDGKRFGYHLTTDGSGIRIEFSGDRPAGDIVLDLPGPSPVGMIVDGTEIASPGQWPIAIPNDARTVKLIRE